MSETLTPEEKATNHETWKHIDRVQQLLAMVVRSLLDRMSAHDQSKLHQPEVSMFVKYTPLLAKMKYSTDPDSEYQKCLKEMKETALEHHYENNRHHPEYFALGVDAMNFIDLIEMLCDWKAAGERHEDGGDILRSIEQNTDRFNLSPQLVKLLKNTAMWLGFTD